MPDQPIPTVTLSMFWPLLMWAAGNEYNTVAHAALDRIQTRTGLALDLICREYVAEEIAREHFPSGTTNASAGFCKVWDSRGERFYWGDEGVLYNTFEDMVRDMAGSGPLSPTDPAHVAMVVRILAISQSLPVYVEGPNVTTRHHEKWPAWDGEDSGPGILLSLERTRPARSSAEPVSVGCFFTYRPGETAENFDVADALFRWLAERHSEIMAATQAEDAADPEPEAASEPSPDNVLKFKS